MGVDSRKKRRPGLNNHVKCLLYLDIKTFYTTIYSKKCFTVAQCAHTHTHRHTHFIKTMLALTTGEVL